MTRHGRLCAALLFGTFAFLLSPTPASAQDGKMDPREAHFGVRGGVSGFPDQFVVGGHVDAPWFHFKTSFRPSVEAGFGGDEDTTLISVNLDLVHWMPFENSSWSGWNMYAGAGVGSNFEFFHGEKEFFGNLSAVFGFQNSGGLFVEMRVGMRPSAKIVVGYVLK